MVLPWLNPINNLSYLISKDLKTKNSSPMIIMGIQMVLKFEIFYRIQWT